MKLHFVLFHGLQIFEERKADSVTFMLIIIKVNSLSSHVMHYVYVCVLWCMCTIHIVHLTSKEMKNMYILFRREYGTWLKKRIVWMKFLWNEFKTMFVFHCVLWCRIYLFPDRTCIGLDFVQTPSSHLFSKNSLID